MTDMRDFDESKYYAEHPELKRGEIMPAHDRRANRLPVSPAKGKGAKMQAQVVLSEAAIKLAVAEYLEVLTNQGKLYADRLNSGDCIEMRGGTRRRIQLCRPGTADYFVLIVGQIIFFEIKKVGGKQSPEQKAFEKIVTEHGARYELVGSLEEVKVIIERTPARLI